MRSICTPTAACRLVSAVVEADLVVPVAACCGGMAWSRNMRQRGQRLVVGREHAALARRDDLVGVEAERRNVTQAAGHARVPICAPCLGRILDKEQIVLLGQRATRPWAPGGRRDARHDRPRRRRDAPGDISRVDEPCRGVDVGKDGRGAGVVHGVGRGDKGGLARSFRRRG